MGEDHVRRHFFVSHSYYLLLLLVRVRKWGCLKSQSRLLSSLSGKSSDDDDENEETKDVESSSALSPLTTVVQKWEAFWQAVDKLWQALVEKLPAPLVNLVSAVVAKLFALRWQFVSFTAGAILTVMAILVPIYSQVETLSKPVTLFETILGDLESAYVDPVDTEKLFETGMAAMLR